MEGKYDHKQIEPKWQKYWEENQTFVANDSDKRPKFYALEMFAYPSGDGLHVGHPRSYTAVDIFARYYRMKGFNVMEPIGWDSFGLPAENYAIKKGVHPAETTKANIANFTRQLKSLGLAYDWSREVTASDPAYYKWTQWVFKTLYDNGLAYRKEAYANWCPKDQTVLANEQVVNGCCERCGTQVEQKKLKQWFFKITDFAEELLTGLDKLDWPESTKAGQRNWIGKSEGARLQFKSGDLNIEVFTTRADTLFGATYLVLAPEHDLVERLTTPEQKAEIDKYIVATKKKSALDRTKALDKTGVFTGSYAMNPATNKEIPIWIADYVLIDYGTGAIMAVPAHDERDFEFAKKFDLPIVQVVAPLFTTTTGDDAPRSDKPTVRREMITAIIKHWKEDKVFCLDWEKFGWKSFVLGGIEEGETPEEAAIRETKEESGYQNIKSVTKIGLNNHSNFFARHKDVNRYSMSDCFVIELADGEYIEPAEEDVAHHKGVWIDRDKVGEYVNLANQIYSADIFLHGEKPYSGQGILMNSGEFDGQDSKEAAAKIAKKFGGEMTVQYKLHDWLLSRQRYWGAPIPVVYRPAGKSNQSHQSEPILPMKGGDEWETVSVGVEDLPVLLPSDVDFKPTGESPLAKSKTFQVGVEDKYGKGAHRELDTMDTFVCSSWYFLRYCDPKNDKEFVGKASLKYWMPVDLYIGGAEHTNGHLLYARFVTKALHKLGYLDFDEPFLKLRHQGLILASDGEKMSKSRGNVINPDELIEQYGADAVRMYEMFMGPFDQAIAWDTNGISGVRKFLERVYRIVSERADKSGGTNDSIHGLMKRVTEHVEEMRFNTAISGMMEFVNGVSKDDSSNWLADFVKLLNPFAPHMAEELWQEVLGQKGSVANADWPKFDADKVVTTTVTIAVQEKGKLRGTVELSVGASEKEVLAVISQDEKLKKVADASTKHIFVPDKIVNFI